METGRTHSSQEVELQRGSKQYRGMQMRSAHEAERRCEHQVATPAWAPPLELDGAPLSSDASIRNFQGGIAGYIANVVEKTLLLPKDMADLRSMRKHEVFLGLKRDLAMVSFLIPFFFLKKKLFLLLRPFKQLLGLRRWRIVAVKAFQVVEKSNQDMKAKPIEAERERKSVAVALDNVERQTKG